MLMCRLTLTKKSSVHVARANKLQEKRKSLSSFLIFCVLGASYEKKQKKDTKFVAICESFEVLGAVLQIREQCIELV